jgi:hypothetical protein
VKDDFPGPDGFEVLDDERVGQETFGFGPNGHLDGADADDAWCGTSSDQAVRVGTSGRCNVLRSDHALERIEVVGQSIDQLPRRELSEEAHREELTDQGAGPQNTDIPRMGLSFFVELQAVGDQGT